MASGTAAAEVLTGFGSAETAGAADIVWLPAGSAVTFEIMGFKGAAIVELALDFGTTAAELLTGMADTVWFAAGAAVMLDTVEFSLATRFDAEFIFGSKGAETELLDKDVELLLICVELPSWD